MLEPPFTLRSFKPQLTLFSLVRIPLGVAIFVATIALSVWGLRELGFDGDMGVYVAFGLSLVVTIVVLRPLERIFPYQKQQDLKVEGDRVELSDLRRPLGSFPVGDLTVAKGLTMDQYARRLDVRREKLTFEGYDEVDDLRTIQAIQLPGRPAPERLASYFYDRDRDHEPLVLLALGRRLTVAVFENESSHGSTRIGVHLRRIY